MAGVYGSAVNWAHVANNVPSILGVMGTLGTADTSGTALTLPASIDPTTGALFVNNLGPAGSVTLGNIPGGTIQKNPIPSIGQLTFGTLGTTGVSFVGTLVGGTSSGAGTEIFITSLSLSIPSSAGSQDVSVGFGTGAGTFHAGTGRLVRGNFLAGGGIQKQFNPPINSGTNAQLCYFQAGAGTINLDITYFIITSTL